jgi:hypothetical protein
MQMVSRTDVTARKPRNLAASSHMEMTLRPSEISETFQARLRRDFARDRMNGSRGGSSLWWTRVSV